MQGDLFTQEDIFPKEELFPLKKYKNQPIEVVLKDSNYCQFLMSRSWFREKYNNIYQIFIGFFGKPEDTPAYNILQAQFDDNDFCMALGKLCNWKGMTKIKCSRNINEAINKISLMLDPYSYGYKQKQEDLEDLKFHKKILSENVYEENGIDYCEGYPLFSIEHEFEEQGWDVIIRSISYNCHDCIVYKNCTVQQNLIGVEIKPSIGDDYPSILREMKNNSIHPDYQCLVYDKFEVTNVTLEQVKNIFSASKIKVFSIDDIEKSKQLLISD